MKCLYFAALLVLPGAVTGCSQGTPPPFPDAMPYVGLRLRPIPDSLLVRPVSTGQLNLLLVDADGHPMAGHQISLTLDYGKGEPPPAWLSSTKLLTNSNGSATVEIITRSLPTGTESLPLVLHAEAEGGEPIQVDIFISTNTYALRVLPAVAEQLLGANIVATVQLSFFDDTNCLSLSLLPLRKSIRPIRTVNLGNDATFSGLSAKRNHAVVGMGYDANAVLRVGGCLDIPGSALIANNNLQGTVFLDQLFPVLTGNYHLFSTFRPTVPLSTDVVTDWQTITTCPYDPARLWLDCTIDAFSTSPTDPLDCNPMTGQEGLLGDLLLARRGIRTTPVTPNIKTSSICHDSVDATGRPSLELLVDFLFSSARNQLSTSKISALPSEIQKLLSVFQVESNFALFKTDLANRYLLDHTLESLSFPNTTQHNSIRFVDIAAPAIRVPSLLATHRREQLSIPMHSFTLRLGTAARIAFESTSLRTRGFASITNLVSTLFEWAVHLDGNSQRRGCQALDTLLCDTLAHPRGCLLAVCREGQDALAHKLEISFERLNGVGNDFHFLSGAGAVLDMDGDGRADSLGTLDSPGLWSAESLRTTSRQQIYGSWTATRQSLP